MLLYSPLQMAADLPKNYMRFPDAFQFIKDVALDWDKSVYLEAEPGEYVTIARKEKGTDNWFVGIQTVIIKGMQKLILVFLIRTKNIQLQYIEIQRTQTMQNPQSYKIETKTVTLKVKLKYYQFLLEDLLFQFS